MRSNGADRPPKSLCRTVTAGGFTMVEMLIAMSLMVMILTALGLSMQGAGDASRWGNNKSRALASATFTLNRICSDLRQADSLVFDGLAATITLPDGTQHVYSWSGTPGGNIIYTDSATGMSGTLVENVEFFQVQPIVGYSPVLGADTVTRGRVTLRVINGEASTELATSVRLRRKIM